MTSGVPGNSPVRQSAAPVVLLVSIYVFALMGRFTLDRLGLDAYGELDLRLVLGPVLLVAVLLWRFRPSAPLRYPAWPAAARWAQAVFGCLALTAFWAPLGARVGERLLDLLMLAFLVGCVVVLAQDDAARARRVVLLALLGTAVVYAVLGVFLGETNVQGRTVALGGGPNVFIRIVGLGLIASVALTVITRRRLFLAPIPLLVAAALFSGSRGGLLALMVTATLFVVLCRRQITARAAMTAAVVAAAAGAAVVGLTSSDIVQVLQERLINDLFVQDQFSSRPQLFSETLNIFLANPWVGGGLDSFYVAFGRSEDLGYPHNLLLEVAAIAGVPALILLCGFVGSLAKLWWSPLRPEADQVALFLSATLIFVASLSSGDLYDTRFLWMLGVLAILPPQSGRYAGKNDPSGIDGAARKV